MDRPVKKPGPRIFCVPATASPILAVLSRGPSGWYHVGRWNVEAWTYEPGASFRGRLFPQKCDLSPDGRWLAYSAHQPSARWPAGTIYEAISRLPWLHALAAWESGTTYTRGIRFDDQATTSDLGAPDVGDVTAVHRKYGVRLNRASQFAVERRRGWVETEDSGPRDPKDLWDERRTVRMRKEQPEGSAVLQVEGAYAAFRDNPDARTPALYSITGQGRTEVLDGVQWADWTATGILLTASTQGSLEAYEWAGGVTRNVYEHDLSGRPLDPAPPPDWAREW